jgi:hypothetical protein
MNAVSDQLQMTVDSVAGNVHDLPGVLEAVRDMAGLKPFFRFELELDHGAVPVVLMMCGDVMLEFLEHAEGNRPDGASHIANVVLEVPDCEPMERELEPGLWLAVRPGPRVRVTEVAVRSGAVHEDLDVLRACGGAVTGEGVLMLGEASSQGSAQGVQIRFLPAPGAELAPDPEQRLAGWHRIGLACKCLDVAVSALAQGGGQIEVPPYQVLPGLREAMLRLPSGLVVQPVEQKLWKMLLAVGVQALAAKVAGHPLRFKTKEA